MKKFVVKLDLANKNAAQKVEFGTHVADSMTGAPEFVSPNPTIIQLTTATTELQTAASNAEAGGFLLTSILHDKEAAFDVVMTAIGKYVDSIAQWSETIIKTAGMDVKGAKSSFTPEQVTGVSAHMGLLSGEILLDWDKLKGSRIFLVYVKTDAEPDSAYRLVALPSKSKVTISGLVAGTRYWFKVEGVYSGNRLGALSDPATAVAAF